MKESGTRKPRGERNANPGIHSNTRIERLLKRVSRQTSALAVSVVLAAALYAPSNAAGTGFQLQFDHIYSGTVPPAHSPPWVDATFQDVSGGVLLSIANVGLSAGEFVSGLSLNLNPAYDPNGPGNLTFTLQSQTGLFDAPTVAGANDAFRAGGDGLFDIQFAFSPRAGSQYRFDDSDSVSYLISGIPGLQASDFAYVSDGTRGGFYGAVHIQGIATGGTTTSVWANPSGISQIPEPNSAVLLVLVAGLWVGIHLRSQPRKSG